MEEKDDMALMQEAIAIADRHGTPYGCVIYDPVSGRKIAFANTTRKDGKTAHAELNALRHLSLLDASDKNKLRLYTTGEPCPMCMGAIIWCGITHVRYGLTIPEISQYHRQIAISSSDIGRHSWLKMNIKGHISLEECQKLFDKYAR